MERRSFHAMGTEVELLLDVEPGAESDAALDRAEQEFERLEQLLSRFRPDSELSALNRLGAIEAGDDLVAVTTLALEARERTGGLFDPTVHDALVAAGYDRTFDELVARTAPAGRRARVRGRSPRRRPDDRARARLPPRPRRHRQGLRRRPRRRAPRDAGPCLVNAGGDLAARDRPWPVGVETARRADHARSRERSDRHLGHGSPPLAARPGRGAPPDRPGAGCRRRATTCA